jgi:hypothetical protein
MVEKLSNAMLKKDKSECITKIRPALNLNKKIHSSSFLKSKATTNMPNISLDMAKHRLNVNLKVFNVLKRRRT